MATAAGTAALGNKINTNSKEIKEKFAESAIVRIRLEHFVTYDSLEFMPGPNLNVIIGPNGTGKSTVVCAICLGMGGKPSVLGRAGNVSDYIKYGKNQATIEIELNNKSGKNFTVRRIIYKDNRSDWFLNDKSVKFKEIEELISRLNIQVGNLCQFLPQEKVAEFARMNKIQLLESTEKAVGGIEMAEMHNELIEKRKLARDYERDLVLIRESLNRETAINARLDNQVASFIEMRKHEEELKWLKRKRACIFYKEKKDEYEKAKKEREKVGTKLAQLDEKFEPMATKQDEITKKLDKYKIASSSKRQNISECTRNINTLAAKLGDTSDKLNDMKNEYSTKEAEFKERKTKLEELKSNIEMLRNELEDAKDNLEEIVAEENRIKNDEMAIKKEIEAISSKEYEIKQDFFKLKNEHSQIEHKLQDMKNIRNEKLNKLRQRAQQAFQATMWLEKNRELFAGQVYEPMVLSINLKNPEFAKYVENLIPFRDLTTMFLFEKSEDMHLFLSEVRDKQNLVVNTALIPNYDLNSFMPPVSIENLKRYGFKSYVRETIAAPDPILVYLCLYSNIHQVPIGTDETQRNISDILPKIQDFNRIYTSTHQYSFSRSRYSNKVSSTSGIVTDAFWLTSSISATELEREEQRRAELVNQMKQLDAKLTKMLDERKKLENRLETLKSELNSQHAKRYRIDALGKKLEAQNKKLKQYLSEKFDLIGDARRILKQIPEVAKKKTLILNEFTALAKKLIELNKERIVLSYTEAQLVTEKLKHEQEIREYHLKKSELESELEHFNQMSKVAREQAREALQAASAENGVNLEKGIPAELKQAFSKLPDTLDKLNAEISQREVFAQAGSDVDEALVKAYYDRKKEIERLTAELEKRTDKLSAHNNNYESQKNEWLSKVEEMIQEINKKFSMLFQQLKCSGEISLDRPDNTEEFGEYGICIKVSFRKEEQLQELTAWQQSGGEKSVSTMMYMIALQEMTKCPFRVVDEINQGMDPVNERKVFDLIVQNSCAKHFAQYFLLTPKLLPDLSFDDRTNVICVFNGPHNLPHTKYNLRHFIEIRKKFQNQK